MKAPKHFATIAALGPLFLFTSCAVPPNISGKTYADQFGDTIAFQNGSATVETQRYRRLYSYRQFRDKGANYVSLSDLLLNPFNPLAQNFAVEVSADGSSLTVSSGNLGFKKGEDIQFTAK